MRELTDYECAAIEPANKPRDMFIQAMPAAGHSLARAIAGAATLAAVAVTNARRLIVDMMRSLLCESYCNRAKACAAWGCLARQRRSAGLA
jgi:hypothetical protein